MKQTKQPNGDSMCPEVEAKAALTLAAARISGGQRGVEVPKDELIPAAMVILPQRLGISWSKEQLHKLLETVYAQRSGAQI